MKLSSISSSPLFYLAGVVIVGGLTLGTVLPTDTTVHHYLASHAIWVMVFFLISGFWGLAIRQNTVILVNFLACIAICSFLKQQNQICPITEQLTTPLMTPANRTILTTHQSTEKTESTKDGAESMFTKTRSPRKTSAMPTIWMSNVP